MPSELIKNILHNDSTDHSQENEKILSRLRREKINEPVIYIGSGTCGLIAGASKTKDAVLKYLNEKGIKADVIETGCIGMCSAEPILDIQLPGKNRISYMHVHEEDVAKILNDTFNNRVNEEHILGQFQGKHLVDWEKVSYIHELPFFAGQTRMVLDYCGRIDPLNIDEYIAHGGYSAFKKSIRHYAPNEITSLVEKSGLRGRGGGGFPTAQKWQIAYNTQSDQKYLICNADESDPGSFMDRALIEGDPHKLIEGIAIAAYAIGASKAYIYIRSEYNLAQQRLRKAIEQAKEYGLLGEDVLNSGFNLYLIIRVGAGAFVCGEETALINSIEGKRGQPSPKPPYPAVQGLHGKPTVVNNVETLSNIPAIIFNGPNWFRAVGTKGSKGTKVFAVSGKTEHIGLIEVAMGTSLQHMIFDIAGGIRNGKRIKAIQIGGASGACLKGDDLETEVDYESLLEAGAMMGSGGLVVMDEDSCMVDVAKFFMQFLANESCGKCIPCREGTQRMLEILENITQKPKDSQQHQSLERFKGVMMLEELAQIIRDTSLCGLGQTAPNPVLSTLKHFREEYEEHIFERTCRANVCKGLREFIIDIDQCTGCTICARKCPVNAIIGSQRQPHFIVQDKCIGCGLCYDSCKFNAIYIH